MNNWGRFLLSLSLSPSLICWWILLSSLPSSFLLLEGWEKNESKMLSNADNKSEIIDLTKILWENDKKVSLMAAAALIRAIWKVICRDRRKISVKSSYSQQLEYERAGDMPGYPRYYDWSVMISIKWYEELLQQEFLSPSFQEERNAWWKSFTRLSPSLDSCNVATDWMTEQFAFISESYYH